MTKYYYTGDVDIRCGGKWLDLSTFDDDYVACIEVTDLESAIGFTNAYLIERGSIYLGDKDNWQKCLDCCGWKLSDLDMSTENGKAMLCEAIMAYRGMDQDYSETIVIGRDSLMESREGWTADRRLRANVNLRKWVMREFNIKEQNR